MLLPFVRQYIQEHFPNVGCCLFGAIMPGGREHGTGEGKCNDNEIADRIARYAFVYT